MYVLLCVRAAFSAFPALCGLHLPHGRASARRRGGEDGRVLASFGDVSARIGVHGHRQEQAYALSHGHIQNAWPKQILSRAFIQNACSGSRGAFGKRAQAPGRAFVQNACMVSSGTRGTGGFWAQRSVSSSRSTPRILKEGALKPTLRYASPCPIFVRPTALLVHSSSTLRPPYGAPRPLFVRPTAPYGARYT